jgi:hypothetical protein
MKRYYFHLASPHGRSDDRAGIRLPDMAAAVEEAIRAALLIIRTPSQTPTTDWRGWRIEVTDQGGVPVFTMPFENALMRRKVAKPG